MEESDAVYLIRHFLNVLHLFCSTPRIGERYTGRWDKVTGKKAWAFKGKKESNLELEIFNAKLKKFNQDYSDVVDAKTVVSVSSTSEAPETSEPTGPAKIEEASVKVASSKGADREWIAETGYCGKNKQGYKEIKIDENGAFSLFQFYAPEPNLWHTFIKGNLRRNEAELDRVKSKNRASEFKKINAEQKGEAWNIT